jgi:hypothetical protein
MYAVQEAVWRQKTKEQKDNAFDKFFKDSKRKKYSYRIRFAWVLSLTRLCFDGLYSMYFCRILSIG